MKLRRFFRRNDADAQLRSELASYLEHATEEFISRGMDQQAARAAANRKLGNATHVCEEVYRMNTISFLEETARNVRFSIRALRKSPAFTSAASGPASIPTSALRSTTRVSPAGAGGVDQECGTGDRWSDRGNGPRPFDRDVLHLLRTESLFREYGRLELLADFGQRRGGRSGASGVHCG